MSTTRSPVEHSITMMVHCVWIPAVFYQSLPAVRHLKVRWGDDWNETSLELCRYDISFFNYTTVDGRKQNEHLYMFKLFECMMMPMRIYGFMMFHVSYIPGAHQISPRQGKPIDYLTRLFMSKTPTKLFESVKQLLTLQWLFMAKLPQLLKQCKQRFIWNDTTTKDTKGPCKPSNLRQSGWKFISCRIHVQDGIVSQSSSVYFVKDWTFHWQNGNGSKSLTSWPKYYSS